MKVSGTNDEKRKNLSRFARRIVGRLPEEVMSYEAKSIN